VKGRCVSELYIGQTGYIFTHAIGVEVGLGVMHDAVVGLELFEEDGVGKEGRVGQDGKFLEAHWVAVVLWGTFSVRTRRGT
jgi:hypothetical protein